MSAGDLPARDATDAARWVAWKGLSPELATVTEENGAATWTIPRWDGPDVIVRFAYTGGDGPSRLLQPRDLADLAVRLVRSIPTRVQGLGPAYLDACLSRVDAARACRVEIRRFPDPGIPSDELARVDGLLQVLWEDLAAARAVIQPFAAEKMTLPGASFALPADADLPTPPYPVETLATLLDRGWGLVDDHVPDRPEIGVLRHPQGAILEVRVRDERTVVAQRVLEGPEAMWSWARYGFELDPALIASLGRHLAPGRVVQEALVAGLEGHVADARTIARFDAGNDRTHRIVLVEQAHPRRRSSCLALVADAEHRLTGAHLLPGAGGFDQLLRTIHRTAVATDPGLQPIGRKLDEADGLRVILGRLLLPGADPARIAAELLARPGDAAQAFVPAVAAGVEASMAEIRASGARIEARGALDLTLAFAEEVAGVRELPQAYADLQRVLKPGTLWASFVFRDPSAAKGIRYDGLVRLPDRWAWFPKPWRLIAWD